MTPKTFYSLERAANLAGVSDQTLRNWVEAKKYEVRHVLNDQRPIFSAEEVEALSALKDK